MKTFARFAIGTMAFSLAIASAMATGAWSLDETGPVTISDGNWRLALKAADGGDYSLGGDTDTAGNAWIAGTGRLDLQDVEKSCGARIVRVGKYAFDKVPAITSVDLPASVKEIGYRSFSSMADLEAVRLPPSLEVIDGSAFRDDKRLASVVPLLPVGLRSIGTHAFSGCHSLAGDLDLAAAPLKEIPSYCFQSTKLLSATMPSIGAVGESAFSSCVSLTNVVVGEGKLKRLSWAAFSGCSALETFTPLLPDSLSSFSGRAFEGCTKLSGRLVIRNRAVKTIPSNTFSGSSLAEVVLPYVTTIGDSTFQNCSVLTNVIASPDLASLEWGAFMKCPQLASFYPTRADSVVKLEGSVFASCPRLKGDFIFNNPKVKAFYARTFTGSAVTSITGTNVTELQSYVFSGCKELTNVVVSHGLRTIGESFASGAAKLRSIAAPMVFPELRSFSWAACSGASALGDTIVLSSPDLKSLANANFSGCSSLASLTLPENLEKVEPNALYNLAPNAEIYFLGPARLKTVGGNAFCPPSQKGCYTIYVPLRMDRPGWSEIVVPLTEEDRADPTFPGEGTIGTWPTAWSGGFKNWVKVWTSPLQVRTGTLLEVR